MASDFDSTRGQPQPGNGGANPGTQRDGSQSGVLGHQVFLAAPTVKEVVPVEVSKVLRHLDSNFLGLLIVVGIMAGVSGWYLNTHAQLRSREMLALLQACVPAYPGTRFRQPAEPSGFTPWLEDGAPGIYPTPRRAPGGDSATAGPGGAGPSGGPVGAPVRPSFPVARIEAEITP